MSTILTTADDSTRPVCNWACLKPTGQQWAQPFSVSRWRVCEDVGDWGLQHLFGIWGSPVTLESLVWVLCWWFRPLMSLTLNLIQAATVPFAVREVAVNYDRAT